MKDDFEAWGDFLRDEADDMYNKEKTNEPHDQVAATMSNALRPNQDHGRGLSHAIPAGHGVVAGISLSKKEVSAAEDIR